MREMTMPKFEVNRYIVVTTEVEAETAEEALWIDDNQETKVTIENINSTLKTTYWWSDNSPWVDDENGETVLED
jgi:hypothetical protein